MAKQYPQRWIKTDARSDVHTDLGGPGTPNDVVPTVTKHIKLYESVMWDASRGIASSAG